MRSLLDQVSNWVAGRWHSIGTDGFGLSDASEPVLRHMDVYPQSIAVAALAESGDVKPETQGRPGSGTASGARPRAMSRSPLGRPSPSLDLLTPSLGCPAVWLFAPPPLPPHVHAPFPPTPSHWSDHTAHIWTRCVVKGEES